MTDADTDAAFPSFDQGLADVLMGQAGLDDGLSGYLGMRMVEVRPGVAVVEAEARDELVHRFGVVHGGVVASLVDQALGAAVLPVIPKGSWPATLEFKLNYLARPGPGRSGRPGRWCRCAAGPRSWRSRWSTTAGRWRSPWGPSASPSRRAEPLTPRCRAGRRG